jgi:hypothetical protein
MQANRFLPLVLAALVSTGAAAAGAAAAGQHALPYTLPAKLEQLRFVVQAKAPGGGTLDLYTDTSGGTFLTVAGATKLKLPYKIPEKPQREAAGKAAWPSFDAGSWLPPPAADADGSLEVPILVPPRGVPGDGMLGLRWFAGRTVEWNYPEGTMRLLPRGALPKVAAAHVIPMGFRKDGRNPQATGFARITARVAGADLQFMFATGATFRLLKDVAPRFGEPVTSQHAGSFIAASHLQDWHARHPDWPYIAYGDAGASMIQVPDMEIAGWHTGPVWFASRKDRMFHEAIATLVDQPLDGALGGNAFASFRITADYPSAKLAFEQLGKSGG